MKIQLFNEFTGEVMERDFRNSIITQTLKSNIARMALFGGCLDDYIYSIYLPKQELVLEEIWLHLPYLLKYNPLLVSMGVCKYILFWSKLKIKIFSVSDGEFVIKEQLDLTQCASVISASNWVFRGFSKETEEFLQESRKSWEGKLRLVPQTSRNSIREHCDSELTATASEMEFEACYRLHLLQCENDIDCIKNGEYPMTMQTEHDLCLYAKTDYEVCGIVNAIEHSYNLRAYYLICQIDEMGRKTLSMLYLSSKIDEWDNERKQASEKQLIACVKVVGSNMVPSFESINVEAFKDNRCNSGLIRKI